MVSEPLIGTFNEKAVIVNSQISQYNNYSTKYSK